MMAAGIFEDQKVELVAGKIYPMTDLPPHTLLVSRALTRSSKSGRDQPGRARRPATWMWFATAQRAGESVPIPLDGSDHGQVAVVDLVAPQA